MAKILLYSDHHWSETSSLIQSHGKTYSTRLENLILGMNWAEYKAVELGCDAIIGLGDFFDKSSLTSAELTALKEISWSDLPHYFLVGNHEGSEHNLFFNSVSALRNLGFKIIDTVYNTSIKNCDFTFIPYITQSDRKPLTEYLTPSTTGRRIIFSHNDIKGLQYGKFLSVDGFEIPEIDANCDLFLNGHLHNGTRFSKKGINLGNFCGQNFNEDAFEYNHCIFILDTDTLELTAIENPFAFNFYKITIQDEREISVLDTLKPYAVISVKCLDTLQNKLTEELEKHKENIVAQRVIYFKNESLSAEQITENLKDLNASDYIQQFGQFVSEKLGFGETVQYELQKIMQ